MKYLKLAFIALGSLCTAVYAADDAAEESTGLTGLESKFCTLDIRADADNDACIKGNSNNLSYNLFLFRDNRTASKLVEGGLTVWEASSPNEHSLDVTVHMDDENSAVLVTTVLMSGDVHKLVYLAKENDKWTQVEREKFTKKFLELKGLESIDNVALDLSDDLSRFDVEEDSRNGVLERQIAPANGERFSSVSIGDLVLLENDDPRECLEVVYYTKNEEGKFIVLFLVDSSDVCQELFFKLEDGKANPLEKDAFVEELGDLSE